MHPLVEVQRRPSPEECIGAYPCPRGARGRLGLGVGLGRRRKGGFSPASLGPVWWAKPLDATRRTMGAPPTLADGDMEAAGTGDWTAGGGATLSKETADPYEGTQYLRVSGAGGATATQSVVTVLGNRYTVTGAARGNGSTGRPRIYSSGTVAFDGTTSAVWQAIDEEFTAAGVGISLYNYAAGPCEWDALVLENVSLTALDPDASATLTDGFAQATATAQPWIDSSTDWLRFDGAADRLVYSGPASDFNFLHYHATNPGNVPEFTIALAVNIDDLTGAGFIFATAAYGTKPGVWIYWEGTGKLGFRIFDATGGNVATATSAAGVVAQDVPFILTATCDGTTLRVYVDGVEVASTSAWGTPSSADCDLACLGEQTTTYSTWWHSGQLTPPFVLDRAVTTTERADLFSWYSAQLSIPLATDELTDAELLTWDGLQLWLDPSQTSTLTMGAPSTPDDWDMELAGTGQYSVTNGSLSKESGAPGGSGSQVLRVTGSGAGSPYAYQAPLINGNRYTVTGYGRGDGSYQPRIWIGSDAWVGTTSTSWQAISGEATASTTQFRLYSNTGAAIGWAEFDDLTFENLTFTAIADYAGVSSDFAQATATAQPWIEQSDGSVEGDGDYLVTGDVKGTWKFLHDGTGMSVFEVWKHPSSLAKFSLGDISGPLHVGMFTGVQSGGKLSIGVANGTGTYAAQVISGVVFTYNQWHVVDHRWGASTNWMSAVDGTTVIDTAVSSPSSSDETYNFAWGALGGGAGGWVGHKGDLIIFNRIVSHTEAYRLRAKLAAKWS